MKMSLTWGALYIALNIEDAGNLALGSADDADIDSSDVGIPSLIQSGNSQIKNIIRDGVLDIHGDSHARDLGGSSVLQIDRSGGHLIVINFLDDQGLHQEFLATRKRALNFFV